jgi:hypothetical protein
MRKKSGNGKREIHWFFLILYIFIYTNTTFRPFLHFFHRGRPVSAPAQGERAAVKEGKKCKKGRPGGKEGKK